MTVTFCVVCEFCFRSDEGNCPLCGWSSSSIPVMFNINHVREIIERVHDFDRKTHIGFIDLTDKYITELKQKIEQLEFRV